MLENNKEDYLNELVRRMLQQDQADGVHTEPDPVDADIQISLNSDKPKIDLLKLAEQLGNVSQACKIWGVSRNTFYRYKAEVAQGGYKASPAKILNLPNVKNRVESRKEQAVLAYALAYPAHGQSRVSKELLEAGIFVSPSGVRCIWLRHNIATIKDRLNALDSKNVKQNSDSTLVQSINVIEKKQLEEKYREGIDSLHPGYLGAQDFLFIGAFIGHGLIYQQTFVDTYSQVAFAKLYAAKTSMTAVDLLTDKVLPFFSMHNLPLLRIITVRTSQYCGHAINHQYQNYLEIKGIEHRKAKVKSKHSHLSCESFYQMHFAELNPLLLTKAYMRIWPPTKMFWINGSTITIMSYPIIVKFAVAVHPWRHFTMA